MLYKTGKRGVAPTWEGPEVHHRGSINKEKSVENSRAFSLKIFKKNMFMEKIIGIKNCRTLVYGNWNR